MKSLSAAEKGPIDFFLIIITTKMEIQIFVKTM